MWLCVRVICVPVSLGARSDISCVCCRSNEKLFPFKTHCSSFFMYMVTHDRKEHGHSKVTQVLSPFSWTVTVSPSVSLGITLME